MSEVIQCPQCDKKFRLPPNPPATFTCTGCGTLMDLSDFAGGADAAPQPPSPPQRAGAPRTRTHRRRGGRGGAPAASAGPAPSRHGSRAGGRARGRRGRGGYDDEMDEGRPGRGRRRKEGNPALVIGSIAAVVVAGVLVLVFGIKGQSEPEKDKTTETAKQDGAARGSDATGGTTAAKNAGASPAGTTSAAGGGTGVEPTAPEGDTPKEAAPVVESKVQKFSPHMRISHVKLQEFPWPEEVDAETRTKVDEAIQNLYRGARDGAEAEEYLVGKGRIIAGRLISEFAKLEKSPGFENREGASMAGVIDSTLRKIDGWQERRWFEENIIRASTLPKVTLRIAQRWTTWWGNGLWKTEPRKPFDSFSESIEELKEAKKHPKKKDDNKGTGYGKRAGG